MQLDLQVMPEASFGAALQAYTGSKPHNAQMRRHALDRGLKLTDYGIYRGKKRIAGRTDEEVYQALGLPWIPPELREARADFELALEGRLPNLLELDDLRGDLHLHTTATDGRVSLEEMVQAARKRRYGYIAITDHSGDVAVARGLYARRLRQQWRANQGSWPGTRSARPVGCGNGCGSGGLSQSSRTTRRSRAAPASSTARRTSGGISSSGASTA